MLFLIMLMMIVAVCPSIAQTSVQLDSITHKLEKIYVLDQGIRDSVHYYEGKYGHNSPEVKAAYKRMQQQDSINQHDVFLILDQYGWLTKKQISKKANETLFFVLQHAEHDAQKKYSVMVDQAFNAGELEKWSYAFFKDRVNMRDGKFQLYGSQVGRDGQGNSYVFPIADEPNVDKRRKKLGMGPLKEHLEYNGIAQYELPSIDRYKGKIVLIGHIMDTSQAGIDGVEVYLKDQLIGKSNKTGFFEIPVSKNSQEKLILSLKKEGRKTITFPISGNRDFYELYFQLK